MNNLPNYMQLTIGRAGIQPRHSLLEPALKVIIIPCVRRTAEFQPGRTTWGAGLVRGAMPKSRQSKPERERVFDSGRPG